MPAKTTTTTTKQGAPADALTNKKQAICITCHKRIYREQGVSVSIADNTWRHRDCPAPARKSATRDRHRMGQHIMRYKGAELRVCGVTGCRYQEYWDDQAGQWFPRRLEGGRSVTAAPEPSLVPLTLWG